MTKLTTWLAAAVVSASLVGCAGNGKVQDGPAPPAQADARVEVTNNNWADMRVFVERGGMRVRLGTVTSMRTASFRIPRTMMNQSGNLRLVADPIGSPERHTSQPLTIWPGQRVEFRIENHLAVSSISVR
jgi:hypothetical protein